MATELRPGPLPVTPYLAPSLHRATDGPSPSDPACDFGLRLGVHDGLKSVLPVVVSHRSTVLTYQIASVELHVSSGSNIDLVLAQLCSAALDHGVAFAIFNGKRLTATRDRLIGTIVTEREPT